MRNTLGHAGQHRDHPMLRSCSGGRERKISLWMCWTWSWSVSMPSAELGIKGFPLLYIGQVVT